MAPKTWLQFSEHSTATLNVHIVCVLTTQSWIRLTLHHIIYLALSSTVDSIEPASTLIDLYIWSIASPTRSTAIRRTRQLAVNCDCFKSGTSAMFGQHDTCERAPVQYDQSIGYDDWLYWFCWRINAASVIIYDMTYCVSMCGI